MPFTPIIPRTDAPTTFPPYSSSQTVTVVNKWIDCVNDNFRELAAPEDIMSPNNTKPRKWHTAAAKDVENGTVGSDLDWVFDHADPKASKTILLCTASAWRKRTVEPLPITKAEFE
jgi:hypothetical protein